MVALFKSLIQSSLVIIFFHTLIMSFSLICKGYETFSIFHLLFAIPTWSNIHYILNWFYPRLFFMCLFLHLHLGVCQAKSHLLNLSIPPKNFNKILSIITLLLSPFPSLRYGFLFLELIVFAICFCYSHFHLGLIWTYTITST